ncbi:YqjF family protein [Nocardiopsis algeriensis]|uniref:DUF2071 domain-containing protein n=1 Tax=Nocardiopsis algeriensis TaxID=1478215 RepID=A0A841IZJ6_9ACTN|nr:DUF2071 domain-containing protein [Nocardiopsis algeriensis]MBB6121875.1 hypothetical protein [Nocardiopsis algeriensis]
MRVHRLWRSEEPGDTAPAPPLPGPALMHQSWRDVLFVHWPVDPEDVAPLLPPHTRPDTLDGAAHVGLVAFHVPGTRVAGVLPAGSFDEVNVRVYAVDGHGRRSTVFLTMDVSSAHIAAAGRAIAGVPYLWADVSLRQGPERHAGAVRRRLPAGAAARWSFRVGERLEETPPLEEFLTARWGLHVRHLGATLWIRNRHRPWPLYRAELLHYEGNLLRSAGLSPLTEEPLSVLWSPGTETGFTPSTVPAPAGGEGP